MRPISTILFLLVFFLACRREEAETTVSTDFSYEITGADFSVPVHIVFTNKTTGARFYKWSFEGGSPETYDKREPGTILFNRAGSIKVKLEAWNDDEHKEKEIIIVLDSPVHAGFEAVPDINNFGPTDFKFTNTSIGVTQFSWQFEGGSPAIATGRNPAPVRFAFPGTYRIQLEARNDRGEKDTISKTVTVRPALTAAFDIEPSFDDDDYEAPLTAKLSNHSVSATLHKWSATGGTVEGPADSVTSIHFVNPGTYTVRYEAGNGKQKDTVIRTITVKPNTGLRSFSNIKLGINTAHAGIGSFFSTRLRQVFKKGELSAANGSKIDLAFFGLSESFSYNQFIRPDSAQFWTFEAIPGATVTKIINRQEVCSCGVNFTAADFDAVTNGSAFNGLAVSVTPEGKSAFNSAVVPRVILFENAWGKRGAVKIKQFVQNGQQSYIVCDIKVQKD